MTGISCSKDRVMIYTAKLIFQKGLSLLMGQGIILFAFVFFLTPLISHIYNLTLKVTGFSYVTVDNLLEFLLHPVSILMMIMMFFVIGLFLLFEIYYLLTYFSLLEKQKKGQTFRALLLALYKLIFFIVRGNIRLIPKAWIMLAIFNLPLVALMIQRNRFLHFYINHIPDPIFGIALGITIIGGIVYLWFRRAFIFHYFIINREPYSKSLEFSKRTKKNHPFQTVFCFLVWNLVLALIIFLIYAFTMVIITFLVSWLFDKRLAIAAFISMNDNLNAYLFTIAFLVSTIGNIAFYTNLFYHHHLDLDKNESQEDLHIDHMITKKEGRKLYHKMAKYTAILLVMINFYLFIKILSNGSPLEYMNLDSTRITSHRGFSNDVPENTLPAIEKAIDEQADQVEVDVRVTKDGELVLLHDGSLLRTTGVNRYIWDMNYEEVADLDAGSFMGKEYKDVRIPTLREVFETCKGKVILNLELKYRNKEEGLEEKVVALMQEYEMEWQCIVSSTSLQCLNRVNELDPDIRTGYIAYQYNMGLSSNESIDFFSMKSTLITKNQVKSIHENGKEVHVWTVNSKAELERMKRIGVDNIITDDPAYAKEILYQSDMDPYFLTLLKVILE